MKSRSLQIALLCAIFVGLMRLSVRGVIPSIVAAFLLPAVLIVLTARAIGDAGSGWRKSPTFWLAAIGTVLLLPTLGTFGLIDPWETHYAEVAREMIERRDFISPWWANEGWFMSKPVLIFWLEALSMLAFGAKSAPDQVLGSASMAAHPEWAIRFPHFVLAMLGALLLADGVAKACGKRAGFLTGIVLLTMPGYALLSHQAMTDMPLVAGIAAALGLALRAMTTNDAALVRTVTLRLRNREFVFHAGVLVGFGLAIVILPQIFLHLGAGPERVIGGDPHVCSLPSQPPCTSTIAAHPRLSPNVQALFWLPGIVMLMLRVTSERRLARLFALIAWFFASLAAMAKGPAGLVVPAAALVVHFVFVARRPQDLLLRFEIISGVLLAVSMIGPWYLAVYARHGRGFLDELVMRHMLGRTLDHLHDTNDGDDTGIVYFIRQIGYATFPWSGIAAAASLAATRTKSFARRTIARSIFFGAAMVAFTLVATMRTKFHHYMLIALPPIAALTGIWIDEIVAIAQSPGGRVSRRKLTASLAIAMAAILTALIAFDIERTPQRFILLMTYRYNRLWPSTLSFPPIAMGVSIAVVGVLIFAVAVNRLRRHAIVAFASLAALFVGWLLIVYLPRCASDGGQREVLRAYYEDRAHHLDAQAVPLVAYQLNWKGENFYTGNGVAIFISSGEPMKTYLARGAKGTRYFVTERGRVSYLRSELGASAKRITEITPKDVSSEFTLVRAELL